jgi:MFS family permease
MTSSDSAQCAVRGALESMFGPLGVQPFASQIYGLYTGFVYLTPIFGGWLADHVLGQRRTVILGAAIMAAGHFMMAFEPLFLLALFTLILGNGAFKPNISTQVGGLYAPGDHRRDRAYSIFYVGINVGAFLAPLICGTLGEEVGWHYGFAAAGVGMTIALAVYLYALAMLPPDERHKAKAAGLAKKPLDRDEWCAVLALAALFLPTTFFWATYEQQGNTIALWADEHTVRTIDLMVWHGEIPVTWFQAFNPFMVLHLHVFRYRILGMAGAPRNGGIDCHQDGARLLRRRLLLSDHGGCGVVGGRWFGHLVVAVCLFHGRHHRRALCFPHRLVTCFENRAGAVDLDNDGSMAWLQFHWQFCRRLAWQLLELYEQDKFLHHDRRCRGERRRGDLVLQPPAQGHTAGLGPAHCYWPRIGDYRADPDRTATRQARGHPLITYAVRLAYAPMGYSVILRPGRRSRSVVLANSPEDELSPVR